MGEQETSRSSRSIDQVITYLEESNPAGPITDKGLEVYVPDGWAHDPGEYADQVRDHLKYIQNLERLRIVLNRKTDTTRATLVKVKRDLARLLRVPYEDIDKLNLIQAILVQPSP